MELSGIPTLLDDLTTRRNELRVLYFRELEELEFEKLQSLVVALQALNAAIAVLSVWEVK
jgi:hypothetical protein